MGHQTLKQTSSRPKRRFVYPRNHFPVATRNSFHKSFQQTRNVVRKTRKKLEGSGGGGRHGGGGAEIPPRDPRGTPQGSLADAADDGPPGPGDAREAASAAAAASISIVVVGEGEIAAAKVAAAFPEKIVFGEAWQVGERN